MTTLDTYLKAVLADSSSVKEKLALEYAALPIPTKRIEDWKFFDAQPIFSKEWKFNSSGSFTKQDFVGIASELTYDSLLVFENGAYNSNFSENSLSIQTISNLKKDSPEFYSSLFNYTGISKNGKFESLNTLCATDGACVLIPEQSAKKHIVVISAFSGQDSYSFQRNIIAVEKGANVIITEICISKDPFEIIANTVTEILVSCNSRVEYTLVQQFANKSSCFSSVQVKQEKESEFVCNVFPLSGLYTRANVWIDKNEVYAQTKLNGLFLCNKNEHAEVYTWVQHNSPDCTTNELFKGLAKDAGQGVFSGKIYVAKDAQKTLATQSNKNILLSDSAKIHSKPQLEIYADDVSCTHGSTTGQINKEALWYMQARGIKKQQALELLLEGFMNDVFDLVSDSSVRNFLCNKYVAKLME